MSSTLNDGSPGTKSDTGPLGCTVSATHKYHWYLSDTTQARNNSPRETSLYPGDLVRGTYKYEEKNCDCGYSITGPTARGNWSEMTGLSLIQDGFNYIQNMKILINEPVPGAKVQNGDLHITEYDNGGRSRSHIHGVVPEVGYTSGTEFTITGKAKNSQNICVVDAKVTLYTKFLYRTPFWETSIHEHHVMTPDGFPALNLDYSNYYHDSMPLEAGSNWLFDDYRWETITVKHEVNNQRMMSQQHCESRSCEIDIPEVLPSNAYVGHGSFNGMAKNQPWDGVTTGLLDNNESMFFLAAPQDTTEIKVQTVMYNDGKEIARGFNSTYQFIPDYNATLNLTPITNTALGEETPLKRPVSLIIQYNGTIPDTLHYCSTGIVHDSNGKALAVGEYGGADNWGRVAGDLCPEDPDYLFKNEWDASQCVTNDNCSYVVHPPTPISSEWGRWSAVNPETRANFYNFTGQHTICPEPWNTTMIPECSSYETDYKNWDYVPQTSRDFIPACLMSQIAAMDVNKNQPRHDTWWKTGNPDDTEYSYRGLWVDIDDGQVIVPANRTHDYYIIDSLLCEEKAGPRDCVERGSLCEERFDRICESVFEPFLYPDDYSITGHERFQEMVYNDEEYQECIKDTRSQTCASETYKRLDDFLTHRCSDIHMVDTHTQIIDTSFYGGGSFTSAYTCHNAYANRWIEVVNSDVLIDWEANINGPTLSGSGTHVQPQWDNIPQSIYVPYTPNTGAFVGIEERPGNILTDDGNITCDCKDKNDDGICDRVGKDLNNNGIVDSWDPLTRDGDILCLDRTGLKENHEDTCLALYGRDKGDPYHSCMADAPNDGPDGRCNPAMIEHPDFADGIPYLDSDGNHLYCQDNTGNCLSSGDTYEVHEQYDICQDPQTPISIKRIPAPASMPPLYKPVFDERWPPECLPDYPVGEWERPSHDVSLDFAHLDGVEWAVGNSSYIGFEVAEDDTRTMLLHAGTGVIRFEACPNCSHNRTDDGYWKGGFTTQLGGNLTYYNGIIHHPTFLQRSSSMVEVMAVKPGGVNDSCVAGSDSIPFCLQDDDVILTLTAYPHMERPVADETQMAAHECQIDGDNHSWFFGLGGFAVDFITPTVPVPQIREYWNDMSCRDGLGISLTVQDFENALHGVAAKRESGQPWTVANGTGRVDMDVFRNGLWLNTLAILEHRGMCTMYTWTQNVTDGASTCPDTTTLLDACIRETGDIRGCLGVHAKNDSCSNTRDGRQYATTDRANLTCSGTGILETDIPYNEVDWGRGGSYACQEVQACEETETIYKCMAGQIVEHTVCMVPEETFDVIMMPYDEVMSNKTPQMLHIEAIWNQIPVYDTHILGGAMNNGTVDRFFVDYYGVGELNIYRTSPGSQTIILEVPETFGDIRMIEYNDIIQEVECSPCIIQYEPAATITVWNLYNGTLTATVDSSHTTLGNIITTDEITGALWIYAPTIIAAAGIIIVLRRVIKYGN